MDGEIDVKALREGLNWTQEQMAEYLGVDRSTVSRVENGASVRGPVRKLLEKLASEPQPAPNEAAA